MTHGQHKNTIGVNLVHYYIAGSTEGNQKLSMFRVEVIRRASSIREFSEYASAFNNGFHGLRRCISIFLA